MLIKDNICEAPGCNRGACISRNGHAVCNLHYQRLLLHNSFDLPQRTVRQDCVCAQCGASFDRGYAISATRRNKPQYCSEECEDTKRRVDAEQREASRFWKNVPVGDPSECWEWTGYRSNLGYGRFTRAGKTGTQMAHRIAYELTYGPLPPHLFACHKCDNPPCCNPNHLFAGTAAENFHDAISKGRWRRPPPRRGAESNKTKLTEDQVKEIRSSEEPARVLATRFGVSKTAIYLIRNKKNWSWLP